VIRGTCLAIAVGLGATAATAQGVRDHTRSNAPRDTTVTESQSVELTLTVIETARRPLQTWVRTAGAPDASGRVLTALVPPPEAGLVEVGQRVRVFPPESKSSMNQAKITRVTRERGGAKVEATIPVRPGHDAEYYVMEIVVERGLFLAVSNEAIIEEGDRQVVYVEQHPGHYVPHEIQTGLKGELYAEVRHGLEEGDRVVTFGSFFIDAEHKLKEAGQNTMSDAHLHH